MSASARKTLILNANYLPLGVWPLSFCSAEEAIKTICRGRADVIEEWPEVFRSPSTEMHIPKTIVLKSFQNVGNKPKFCRRSILLRDRYECQYCGGKFESQDLTYDHVLPRSKGGQTTWENVLCACGPCNARKADQMPSYSGRKGKKGDLLRPLKQPRQPTTAELLRNGLELLDPQIKEDWKDWLYWNVPLDP